MVGTLDHAVSHPSDAGVKTNDEYELNEVERAEPNVAGLPSDDEDVPELHARTWIAITAFFLLNFTQVVALQGPSTVVCAGLPYDETSDH